MVIGHFGFGLGAKKFAPKLSLGTLFIAVQWADLLWPVLLLLGVEHVEIQPGNSKFPFNFTDYPISHSLLMGMVWGLAFGVVCWLVKKDMRSAVAAGICVLSHWVLDLIVHKPDLPLFPGHSPLVGMGLWNWPLLAALAEFVLFGIGLAMYLRATTAENKTGTWSLWLLVILLVINQLAARLSPPPASVTMLSWAAQYQWIFVVMGYWVDRNRVVRVSQNQVATV